ncbi:hypothetical protein Ahy_A03g013311 [Arachis hypogaea]|uniref:Aminotransferase-like plant mobile domain-containing protein n=1 Tax=Arachis hypogaea TaxID=3818 RepID=A0A445DV67_ARAHY|nr:hypothetical protein Ahy_A03g013311 [Arachis hypogaea]
MGKAHSQHARGMVAEPETDVAARPQHARGMVTQSEKHVAGRPQHARGVLTHHAGGVVLVASPSSNAAPRRGRVAGLPGCRGQPPPPGTSANIEAIDNAKSYIKLGWVRRIRDAELLDTEESIRQYFRCQIFCLLGSTLFTDKSTAYAHAKYPPLLRDFERIHTYSWGSACLAHLYRTLCRASRYDTKEMDGPLNLLFVWAWERMPCLAPVPRQTLPPAEIPVARRWSHSERTTAWSSKTVETFRHDIDNKLLQVRDFEYP